MQGKMLSPALVVPDAPGARHWNRIDCVPSRFLVRRHRLVLPLLLTLIVVGCSPAPQRGVTPTVGREPSPGPHTGPGKLVSTLEPPSPTTTPGAEPGGQPPQFSEIPERFLSAIVSSTTVATSLTPAWTSYASINQVWDLAFSPDGTLWAVTSGGLVHWDLESRSYTRYQIQAGHMALDPSGVPWLATEAGLCRLDSSVCAPFIPLAELETRAIRALAVTKEGIVWVGTGEGVSRFDGQNWQHYPSPVSTNDLAMAASGEIWAATSGGVGRYQPAQDTWVTYTERDGLPSVQAQAVAVGPQGDVWASMTWEGLVRFDGERWQRIEEPPGGLVGGVAFDSDGTPWVGTVGSLHYPGGSLSYLEGDKWIDVGQATADLGEGELTSFRAIAAGRGGVMATATNLGLGIYQEGRWLLLRDGPLSNRVTSVAVTPDGAAWFGFGDHSVSTTGGGLSRFDGQEWQYFLEDAEVNALAVAPDGALWAGVGCGILRLDGSTWQTIARCEQDLPLGNVLDLAFSQDGTTWAATGFGLAKYDGQSWTVYDRLANSVIAAPDGSIWINGWEGSVDSWYIARFDPLFPGPAWTTYYVSESFLGAFVLRAVTPDGRLWGSVPERGLAGFDGGDWTAGESWSFNATTGRLALSAGFRLTAAPDGTLWVQTREGVAQLDPTAGAAQGGSGVAQGVWTEYSLDGDSPADSMGPIAFGTRGEVWFGATRFWPPRDDGE